MFEKYQFNYILSGNPHKPLIIFLHGFMGNINEFDEIISIISEDFYCLKIDLPGHGKTQVFGSDEYYQMPNTAKALIKLLDELLKKLNLDQCFLIGYSMGGRLAFYLALNFPQYFTKVILESASPGLATEPERLGRMKQDAQIARKLSRTTNPEDFTLFLTNWYSQEIFGDIKTHTQFSELIKQRLQNDPKQLIKSLKMMGTGVQPSLWSKLETNNVPLLLLVGELDPKFVEINTKIQQKAKYSQLEIVRDTAHNIHFAKSLEFVSVVKNFFVTKS